MSFRNVASRGGLKSGNEGGTACSVDSHLLSYACSATSTFPLRGAGEMFMLEAGIHAACISDRRVCAMRCTTT